MEGPALRLLFFFFSAFFVACHGASSATSVTTWNAPATVLTSTNNFYSLTLLTTGIMQITYLPSPQYVTWSTPYASWCINLNTVYLTLQNDGNLVIYATCNGSPGVAIWAPGPYGGAGTYTMTLDQFGLLDVYGAIPVRYGFNGYWTPLLNGISSTTYGTASFASNALIVNSNAATTYGNAWSINASVLYGDFTFFFAFKIAAGATPGDGMTFILSPSTYAGTATQYLGFKASSGSPTSVAVEFDNYADSGCSDPAVPHVGIDLPSLCVSSYSAPISTAIPGITPAIFGNNSTYYAWIDYNLTSNTMYVRIANTNTKPASALLTAALATNLFTTLGTQFPFFGFSGSTGASDTESHTITSVGLSVDGSLQFLYGAICDFSLCQNGGTCASANNNCTCLSGYTGTFCQYNMSGCLAAPCTNGGTCTPILGGNYTCACLSGYNGTTCANNYTGCNTNNCVNGGTCTPILGGTYSCACLAGTNGTTCQNNYTGCLSGPCFNGATCTVSNNSYTCACLPGFSGTRCNNVGTLVSAPSANASANQYFGNQVALNDYFFVVCDKLGHAFFYLLHPPTYLMSATVGGTACAPAINVNGVVLVGNPTQGSASVTQFFCNQNTSACTLVGNLTTPSQVASSGNLNWGQSISSSGGIYFAITAANLNGQAGAPYLFLYNCLPPYASSLCAQSSFVAIPGGTGSASGQYTCLSSSMVMVSTLGGSHFLIFYYTSQGAINSTVYYSGGIFNGIGTPACYTNPTSGNSTFAGPVSVGTTSAAVILYACANGTGGASTAQCVFGSAFYYPLTGTVDTTFGTSVALNGNTMLIGSPGTNTVFEYTAAANDGLSFSFNGAWENVDAIASAALGTSLAMTPAGNSLSGAINYQNGAFSNSGSVIVGASCPLGYNGTTCQNNYTGCNTNNCANGGTCNVILGGGYSCSCPPGYNGTTCQNNYTGCLASPCNNGGTCTPILGGSFSCACAASINGTTCQNNYSGCLSSPYVCYNGGTCAPTNNSFVCTCAPGYNGTNCAVYGATVFDSSPAPYISMGSSIAVSDNFAIVSSQNGAYFYYKTPTTAYSLTYTYLSGAVHNMAIGSNGVVLMANKNANGGATPGIVVQFYCNSTSGTVSYTGQLPTLPIVNASKIAFGSGIAAYGTYFVLQNGQDGTSGYNYGFFLYNCPTPGVLCTNVTANFNNPPTYLSVCITQNIISTANGLYTYNASGVGSLPFFNNSVGTPSTPACYYNTTTGISSFVFLASNHRVYIVTCTNATVPVCTNSTPFGTPDGASSSTFGTVAAINSNTLLVSAYDLNVIYVFFAPSGDGATFSWTGGISEAITGNYGATVALSPYGNSVAGAPLYSSTFIDSGAAILGVACPPGYMGVNCTQYASCTPSPCLSGGTCATQGPYSYLCSCLSGYNGTTCQNNYTGCLASPCNNGGTCTPVLGGNYSCSCLSGYNGTTCANNYTGCNTNNCANGGTCNVILGGNYSCSCLSGYNGTTCQNNYTGCLASPCNNGGTCTPVLGGSYLCSCAAGYNGTTCQNNYAGCLGNIVCYNGGTCTPVLGGTYSCACTSLFSGSQCGLYGNEVTQQVSAGVFSFGFEVALNDQFAVVYDSNGNIWFFLLNPWTYLYSSRPTYGAFAYCSAAISSTGIVIASFVTSFSSGNIYQYYCNGTSLTCAEVGQVTQPAEVSFYSLAFGYSISNYGNYFLVGAPSTSSQSMVFLYACQPPYSSTLCTRNASAIFGQAYLGLDVCITDTQIGISSPSTLLVGPYGPGVISFGSPSSWSDADTINPLYPLACTPSGSMNVSTFAFISSTTTVQVISCNASLSVSSCTSVATLSHPATGGAYTQYLMSLAMNKNVLLVGDGGGNQVFVYYSTSGDGTHYAWNGGVHQTSNSPSYLGFSVAITATGNSISGEPQATFSGTSQYGMVLVGVACPYGYNGTNCTNNYTGCASSPCIDGGSCTPLSTGSYSCSCPPGYNGTTCANNYTGCNTNNCLNGGTCNVILGGGYSCSCAAGFNGTLCGNNFSGCFSSPCLSGGTCTPVLGGSFSCACAVGYNGTTCQNNYSGCLSSPYACYNGGTCAPTNNSVVCTCAPGYGGGNCAVYGTTVFDSSPSPYINMGSNVALSDNFAIVSSKNGAYFYYKTPTTAFSLTYTYVSNAVHGMAIGSNGVVLMANKNPDLGVTPGIVVQFYCNSTSGTVSFTGQLPTLPIVNASKIAFGVGIAAYGTYFVLQNAQDGTSGYNYGFFLYNCPTPGVLCTNVTANFNNPAAYLSVCITQNIISTANGLYTYNASGVGSSPFFNNSVGTPSTPACYYNTTTGISSFVFLASNHRVYIVTCTNATVPVCTNHTSFGTPDGASSSTFGTAAAINSNTLLVSAYDLNVIYVFFAPSGDGATFSWTGGINDALTGNYGATVALSPYGNSVAGAPLYSSTFSSSGAGILGVACPPGYMGVNCTQYASCTPSPCLSGGTCVTQGPYSYLCSCPLGYNGTLCANNYAGCNTNNCQNGATCSPILGGAYTCTCAAGYNGTTCQNNYSGCVASPCGLGGTCTPILGGTFTCACFTGYNGTTCANNYTGCLSAPCLNGSTCTPVLGGSFSCACVFGFSGTLCNRYVCQGNPCASSPNMTCTALSGLSYTCTCAPNATCSSSSPSSDALFALVGFDTQGGDRFGTGVASNDDFYVVSNAGGTIYFFYQNQSNPVLNVRALPPFYGGSLYGSAFGSAIAVNSAGVVLVTNSVQSSVPYTVYTVAIFYCNVTSITCTFVGTIPTPAAVAGNQAGFGYAIAADYQGSYFAVSAPSYTADIIYVYSCPPNSACTLYSTLPVTVSSLVGWSVCLTPTIVVAGTINSVLVVFDLVNSTQVDVVYGSGDLGFALACFFNTTTQTSTVVASMISSHQFYVMTCAPGDLCVGVATFSPPPGQAGSFPYAVAVNSNELLIGSYNGGVYQYLSANSDGANYVYWSSDSLGSGTGYSVSLTPLGTTIVGDPALTSGGVALIKITCPAGYNGTNCANNYTGCLASPCVNGGNCSAILGGTFSCSCPLGYNGTLCQYNYTGCNTNNCQNGATCNVILGGNFSCSCAAGYNGTLCSNNYTGCLSAPCFNGATCTAILGGGFTCACPAGYNGTTCANNYTGCLSSPCVSGGTCTPVLGGNYSCACAAGYNGTTCANNYTGCLSSPCVDGGTCTAVLGGGFTCACPAGYNGTTCANNYTGCLSSPCVDGGTCTAVLGGGFTCACLPGFNGTTCGNDYTGCLSAPCLSGGTCTPILGGTHSCACPPGYNGTNCANNYTGCLAGPCLNGATCAVILGGGYSCSCASGFNGTTCSNDYSGCNTNNCINGATCNVILGGGFACACLPQFNGTLCQNDYSHCQSSPCVHGGTCTAILNGFVCACPRGENGTDCQNDYSGCNTNNCANGGTCSPILGGNYSCHCGIGFNGTNCTNDYSGCNTNACANGGTCTAVLGGTYLCSCPVGFNGTNCTNNYSGCNTNNCANGATCNVILGGGYSCSCLSGYNGTTCQNNYSGCLSAPCVDGGTCTPIQGGTYSCACPAGFNGTNCQNDYTGCLSTPCTNGATCSVVLGGSYTCLCAAGYNGTHCENNYSGCLASPCVNGGNCSAILGGTFSCACLPGFNGTTCGNDYTGCLSSPCVDGGTCTPVLGGSYSCACPPGFNGTTCANNYTGCLSAPCANGGTCSVILGGGFTCACPSGINGTNCQNNYNGCSLQACANGGTCSPVLGGLIMCHCPTGFNGSNCEHDYSGCLAVPCAHNGTCTPVLGGTYSCACPTGFTGTSCQNDFSGCLTVPCLNSGVCIALLGGIYNCSCLQGYNGTNCVNNYSGCLSGPCLDGGNCLAILGGGFNCSCPPGFNGTACENDYSGCLVESCVNGGTCTALLGGNYSCACPAGFNGTNCTNDYTGCLSAPCHNSATCSAVLGGTFTCSCASGFNGTTCSNDYSGCNTNNCLNGATCNVILGGAFTCSCPAGFNGTTCGNNYAGCLGNGFCENGATCIPVLGGGFNCSCPPGFNGSLCDNDFAGCLPVNPCQNGGICSPRSGGLFACSCPPGYSGANCAANYTGCLSSPCASNANCTAVLGGTFTCSCASGFNGTTCSDDYSGCLSNPCANGARCLPVLGGTFTCACPAGFNGTNCTNNYSGCLNSNPCSNGGTCSALLGGTYTCSCAPGFNGTTCGNDFSGCISGPCLNGGNCSAFSGGFYVCTCPPGFFGTICEEDYTGCLSTPCVNGSTCNPILGGAYSCACPPGENGTECQNNYSGCNTPGICENGGTCSPVLGGAYACTCLPGYNGTNCTNDYTGCIGNSFCMNGATCNPILGGAFACECAPGFNGTDCSNDYSGCVSTPCHFGSPCTAFLGGTYNCTCVNGSSGINCSVSADIAVVTSALGSAVYSNDTNLCHSSYASVFNCSGANIVAVAIQPNWTTNGTIPTFIQNLTSIQSVQVQGSNITGTVPTFLGTLANLTTLVISGTSIAGSIPSEVWNSPSITTLIVTNNTLMNGTIPGNSSLIFSTKIFMNFSSTGLTGNIPNVPLIAAVPVNTTVVIDFSQNNLTGSVPANISSYNASGLILHLQNNKLTGSVPNFQAPVGQYDLRKNGLTGSVPAALVAKLTAASSSSGGSRRKRSLNENEPLLYLQGNPLSCPVIDYSGVYYNDYVACQICAADPCGASANLCWENYALNFNCTCALGYSGIYCGNDYAGCIIGPCLHGGTCTSLSGGSFSCSCPAGYSGVECQTYTPPRTSAASSLEPISLSLVFLWFLFFV